MGQRPVWAGSSLWCRRQDCEPGPAQSTHTGAPRLAAVWPRTGEGAGRHHPFPHCVRGGHAGTPTVHVTPRCQRYPPSRRSRAARTRSPWHFRRHRRRTRRRGEWGAVLAAAPATSAWGRRGASSSGRVVEARRAFLVVSVRPLRCLCARLGALFLGPVLRLRGEAPSGQRFFSLSSSSPL